ncbi:MAG: DMT family transporter [Succinivibrionaceae bacterium]|nr:DMT family transporter [Succinivibrionaceae bacterium]
MLPVFLKLHLAVFIAGFTGLFGRLISLDAFLIVYLRLAIGGMCLWLVVSLLGGKRSLTGHEISRALALGALLACHIFLFYLSIKLSNVSIGVVCVSTIGFFVAIIEPLVFHSRFSVTDLAYSLIAIAGVCFIFGFDPRYRLGIAVGLGCSLLSGIYAILNRAEASLCDSRTFIAWQLLGGTLFMTLLLPLHGMMSGGLPSSISLRDGLWLLLAGTVCTAGLYILQVEVLRSLSAFTVMLTFNLEPIYSIVLAMLIFSEASELNFAFYVGLALILVSVGLKTSKALHLKRKAGR